MIILQQNSYVFVVQFHQDLGNFLLSSTDQGGSNFEVLNFFSKDKKEIVIHGLEEPLLFTNKKLTPTPKDLNSDAYICQYFDMELLQWMTLGCEMIG